MKSKLKYLLLAAGVCFLGLSSAVLSQSIVVPKVALINPTDLIQILPLGAPQASNQYATPSQITSQMGYYKGVPPNLFTFTFANNQSLADFVPSGTLAYGYITFAPAPSDGAQECFYSKAAITTLYLSANTGQTLNDAVTTLGALAQNCYLYSASNATWDRSK
jgi:hypothetical protein